jgi:hypothetical protein
VEEIHCVLIPGTSLPGLKSNARTCISNDDFKKELSARTYIKGRNQSILDSLDSNENQRVLEKSVEGV